MVILNDSQCVAANPGLDAGRIIPQPDGVDVSDLPFKRKKRAGDEKWYEKIKMSYSGQFQNSLTAKQDVFFKKA